MKLTVYLFKNFLPLLFGTVCLFVLGFEIVDLFMNIWKYILNNVPAKTVVSILMYYLPKSIFYAMPLSVLFASCYMLCIFASHNELIALFCSGVSYTRFMLPLIIFSGLLSVGFFYFEDKVVVPCYSKYEEIQNAALHIEKNQNNSNIVIRSDNGKLIYKADLYENSVKKLHNLYVIVREEDHSLNSIIKASNASWDEKENCWIMTNPVLYKVNKDGEFYYVKSTGEFEKYLTEPPDTFKNNKVNIETVSVKEAREYIEYLKRTGLPMGESLSVYYKKYSFPFVIVIVTILAIGLSGRSKRNVIIVSLILSLSSAVLFYVFQMVTMLMAKFGIISAMMGAWFPVIVFLILSVLLLRYTKT